MKIELLDGKGYVEFIEAWGHGKAGFDENREGWTNFDYEVGIVEAARQSTQGSFRGWTVDELLLKTLFYSHPKHAGPFEFAGMIIEVQAPIGVFREWHRHRTQSYNEMSARYAPLPDEYYLPDFDLIKRRSHEAATTRNKQLQGLVSVKAPPPDEQIVAWHDALMRKYEFDEEFYQLGLKIGIPKELARWGMPVGHYSRMRASANLRNWLAFLTLRDEEGVMHETRECAHAVGVLVEDKFPRTYGLFQHERELLKEWLAFRSTRV